MSLQQLMMLTLQISILLTVFGFGLQATVDDIRDVTRRPSLLARSLAAMFLIMPLFAVAAVATFALRLPVAIVLVALAISPVPPLLPGKQRKAGGDTSYGLGLMAIVSLLSIAVVPLSVQTLGRVFEQPFRMPPSAIAAVMFKAALLPLALGMLGRAFLPAVANLIAKPIAVVAKVLLAAGALPILVAALPAAVALIGNGTFAALAAFVVVGLVVGHSLGGPRADDRVVLALSTASRHPAIALAVARTNFPDEPHLGAAILLYLLVGAVVGVLYMAWLRRRPEEIASPA